MEIFIPTLHIAEVYLRQLNNIKLLMRRKKRSNELDQKSKARPWIVLAACKGILRFETVLVGEWHFAALVI